MSEYLFEFFTAYFGTLLEESSDILDIFKPFDNPEFKESRPPHNDFAPSRAALEMAESRMCQHRHAIDNEYISSDDGFHELRLGDLLVKRRSTDKGGGVEEIYLVVTPDCDMVRGDARFVFWINGEIHEYGSEGLRFGSSNGPDILRVPITIDGRMFVSTWNPKTAEPLLSTQFKERVIDQAFERVGRLRSPWALILQQGILNKLGRIGAPTQVPDRRAYNFECFVAGRDEKWKSIYSGGQAFLIGGQKKDGRNHRLKIQNEPFNNMMRALMRELQDRQNDHSEVAKQTKCEIDLAELVNSYELQKKIRQFTELKKMDPGSSTRFGVKETGSNQAILVQISADENETLENQPTKNSYLAILLRAIEEE